MKVIIDFFVHIWDSIVEFFNKSGENIVLAFLVLILGHYAIKGFMALLRKIFNIRKRQVDKNAKTFLMSLINILLRFSLCVAVLILLNVPLDNFVAILSAGVLAIGLSLQDSIGNFASGVMILSTKPFITGDFIEMDGGNGGTVSEIRMMTTILNTPNNQRLIIPNSQVMKSKITNYTSYPIRRMDLVISVSVTTDIEKAKEVILKKLQEDSRVLTAPAPTVMLKTINGSSLDIGVRGFTENNDYWTTTWAINEAIILAFRKQKINIPHNRVEVSLVNPNDIEQLTR